MTYIIPQDNNKDYFAIVSKTLFGFEQTMMKLSKKNRCESCGTLLYHLVDFGTHEDGTIHTEYCRHCYQDGQFVDHGITLEQKIQKNIALGQKKGMSREEATLLAQTTLPKLKRWKLMKPVE